MDIIIMFYYMDFMNTVWSKLQAYILKCIKNVILRVQKVFSLNLYLWTWFLQTSMSGLFKDLPPPQPAHLEKKNHFELLWVNPGIKV